MKTNWKTKRLGDLCEDVLKKHPSDIFDDNFSYIDISSVDPKQKKIVSPKLLNVQDAPGRARKVVKSGDIIFATTRPYLENIAIVGDELENPISSTGFCVISPKPKMLDSKFAYLVITSSQFVEKVVSKQKGASYPAVSDSVIYDIEIPLPSLEEQKHIVKVLEEKLGKVKEAMTLRQDSIADTEKILSAKLSEIFTEGKEKGWATGSFKDLTDEHDKNAIKPGPFGSSLKKSFYVAEGYKIYGQEQVISGNPNLGDYYVDEDKYEELKSFKVSAGDVLISLVGTIGKVLIVPEKFEPGIINPRLLKISPDPQKAIPGYITYLLKSPAIMADAVANSHGATMSILNKKILLSVKIPIPDLKIQEKIVKELDELSVRVAELCSLQEEQLADLKSLERAYLHEAFNGELV